MSTLKMAGYAQRKIWTPHGLLRFDAEGVAHPTEDQAAYVQGLIDEERLPKPETESKAIAGAKAKEKAA